MTAGFWYTQNMDTQNHIAEAEVAINAPVSKIWEALVTPEIIKQYMFGTTVVSDWQVGSPIVWKGEYEGKTYEDHGVIVSIEPEREISYKHSSQSQTAPEAPEKYHLIRITLAPDNLAPDSDHTTVRLTQDANATEKERDQSAKNWQMMLDSMKKILEN